MVTRMTGHLRLEKKIFQGAVIHPGSFDRTVFK